MKTHTIALILTLASAGSALAQSPAPPVTPAQQNPSQTRATPNEQQQLRDWQQERADEYYRRLREYVASVGRMA